MLIKRIFVFMKTPGNPDGFWPHIECFFSSWVRKLSPVRWWPWGTVLTNREGVYVFIRFIILLVLAERSPFHEWYLRIFALAIALFLILDIIIYHTAVAFVTREPENLLRSAILSTFSFVQLPVGFAIFYRSLNNSFCSSLSTLQALYFSFVTITTLGYGDIKPKADASVAQGFVIVEVVVGVYFIAVLIARLINLSSKEMTKKTDDNGTNERLKT